MKKFVLILSLVLISIYAYAHSKYVLKFFTGMYMRIKDWTYDPTSDFFLPEETAKNLWGNFLSSAIAISLTFAVFGIGRHLKISSSKRLLATKIRDNLFEFITDSGAESSEHINNITYLCQRAETLIDSYEWSTPDRFREALRDFVTDPKDKYLRQALVFRFSDLINKLGIKGNDHEVFVDRINIALHYGGLEHK